MKAATIAELYDFNTLFEDAAAAALTAEGLDVAAPGDAENLSSLQVAIGFDVGASDGVLQELDSGRVEYTRYRGCTLTVGIAVRRDATNHKALMASTSGKVRSVFAHQFGQLSRDRLKFYEVTSIVPAGESNGTDEFNRDTRSFRWSVDFEILNQAWP